MGREIPMWVERHIVVCVMIAKDTLLWKGKS